MSGDLKCDTCNSTFYSEPGRFEPDELCGLALSDDGPVCPGSLRDITPLSQREQARLARIQEQSRQLSLEECVYWLEVLRISAINWTVRDWSQGAIVTAILRDAPGVRYWNRGIGGGYPSKHSRERREAIVLSVLCREVRRRIRELQR